jgi:hypothetical protein
MRRNVISVIDSYPSAAIGSSHVRNASLTAVGCSMVDMCPQ